MTQPSEKALETPPSIVQHTETYYIDRVVLALDTHAQVFPECTTLIIVKDEKQQSE